MSETWKDVVNSNKGICYRIIFNKNHDKSEHLYNIIIAIINQEKNSLTMSHIIHDEHMKVIKRVLEAENADSFISRVYRVDGGNESITFYHTGDILFDVTMMNILSYLAWDGKSELAITTESDIENQNKLMQESAEEFADPDDAYPSTVYTPYVLRCDRVDILLSMFSSGFLHQLLKHTPNKTGDVQTFLFGPAIS